MTHAPHRAVRRLAAAAAACGALAATGDARADTASPAAQARVAVVGDDSAFVRFPSTIAAGPTLFSFENRGRVRHEMALALLQPGLTVQQVLERGPGAASSRAVTERVVGILIARPGESGGGQLLVELQAGRRYIVICNLKDAPESQPHSALGMVTSFDVP